jgi:hypothetical protein
MVSAPNCFGEAKRVKKAGLVFRGRSVKRPRSSTWARRSRALEAAWHRRLAARTKPHRQRAGRHAHHDPIPHRPDLADGVSLFVSPHLLVHAFRRVAKGQLPQGDQVPRFKKVFQSRGPASSPLYTLPFLQVALRRSSGAKSTNSKSWAPWRKTCPERFPAPPRPSPEPPRRSNFPSVERSRWCRRRSPRPTISSTSCQRLAWRSPSALVWASSSKRSRRGRRAKSSVQIELMENHRFVRHLFSRQDFQPLHERLRLRAAVGFHQPHHHVPAFLFPLTGGFQHGSRFSPHRGWRQKKVLTDRGRWILLRLGRVSEAGRDPDVDPYRSARPRKGVQRQVEFQHIDPGFAQNPQKSPVGIFRNQSLHRLFRDSTDAGNSF